MGLFCMSKRKRNYVNNKDFLEALREYKKACVEAENCGEELPQIPKYIGECIYKISTNLASKPNFSRYVFINDMIMDGVETSFRYIDRFDGDKYDNPFAFFSTVIWNAFVQRIQKEKKELYIKYKCSISKYGDGGCFEQDLFNEANMTHQNIDVEYMHAYIEDYEKKLLEKKEKIKKAKEEKNMVV